MHRTRFIVLALSLVALLGGCEERTVSVSADANVNISDERTGKGAKAEKGDLVRVHYTGATEEGEVLISTYDNQRAHNFIIGDGTVIPGMDLGVIGMRAGGKRVIVMPPQAHYGRGGYGGKIPPETTLVFEIEMIRISTPDPMSGGDLHPNDPRRSHNRGPRR